MNNRADGYSRKGSREAALKFRSKAEHEFEKALEYLQEVVHRDRALCAWFDRDTSWGPESEAGIDPASIPRVITSRSWDCSGSFQNQKNSKNEIKRMIVGAALNELINPPKELTEAQKEKLKRLYKKLDQLGRY